MYELMVKSIAPVIGAGIGFLLKVLWDSILKHLLSHITYGGIKVEGVWTTKLGESDYEERVILKRFGSIVHGEIQVTKSPTNADVGKKYPIKGRIVGGHLIAEYSIDEEGHFDIGSFMLEIVNGGQNMSGKSIGYYDPGHKVESWCYEWSKVA